MSELRANKERERAVGAVFIKVYNARECASFRVDETYWDSDPDAAPDLRFQDSTGRHLYAEVVCVVEGGEDGFREAAGRKRLSEGLESHLSARGISEVTVTVSLVKFPVGAELKEMVAAIVDFVDDDVHGSLDDLRRSGKRERRARHSRLLQWVREIKCRPGPPAVLLTGAGIAEPNVASLKAVLDRKMQKRYEHGTHLLIDNASWPISREVIVQVLGETDAKAVYEGVWLVRLQESTAILLTE